MAKKIKSLGFTIDELKETQDELISNIEDMDGDPELKIRIIRIIKNKFGYCKNMVAGQNWLEEKGLIEVL